MTKHLSHGATLLMAGGDERRLVVVSTAHLPEWLAQNMEHKPDLVDFSYDTTEWGFRVYAGLEGPYPSEIQPIVHAAHDAGMTWVEFDSDGPIVEGFPTWEW